MALVLADRVQETSTSPGGTGALNLSGTAPAGFKTFSAGIGSTNSTYYCIFDTIAYDWEVGIGTYTSGSPGTLTRTTVLSNSANTTANINFTNGNTLNVFCTYPSEKSINYDANGVATIGSPLGYSDTGIIGSFASTVAGYNQVVVQNKSTATNASANINVSNDAGSATDNYAEFGINSSTYSGDSSFDLPGAAYVSSATTPLTIGTYGADAIHFITNGDSTTTDAMTIYEDGSVTLGGLPQSGIGNISCNNINLKFQQIATTGGTTTLTNASPYYTQFTGTSAQDLVLPNATTCLAGTTFIFDNDSTQTVTIKDGAGTSFEILVPGGFHTFILEDNSTVAGTWLRYSQVPSTVEWGTNSLSLASTVISGGTWQGGTIQPGYGGTGLTTFSAANNALYSTGASTLTAGTLPVAAGGSGQTSFGSGQIHYGSFSTNSNFVFDGTNLGVGTSSPSGKLNVSGATVIARITGTDGIGILRYNDGSSDVAQLAIAGGETIVDYNGPLKFRSGVNGTERMRLDSSGNLGLGVTPSAWRSATKAIQINATGAVHGYSSGGTTAVSLSNNLYINSSDNGIYLTNGYATNYYQTSGQHVWLNAPSGTAGATASLTQAMTLDASGNLGIGTSSPTSYSSKFIEVSNATSAGLKLTAGTSGLALGADVSYIAADKSLRIGTYESTGYVQFRTQDIERARISAAGGFSVGTTADPGSGAIYATGNITAYYSDDRLKTKLGGIENALDKVKSLSGFYYEANQTAQDLGYQAVREVGVSAQQVQAVMPEVVKPAPIDQQYLTVDYERLVPLLIEAIKELEEKVAKLEAK